MINYDLLIEALVFSDKPLLYKYDEWENESSNKLFIVGLSGSGKSTIGKRLAKKYNCRLVNLDYLCFKILREFNQKFKLGYSPPSYELLMKTLLIVEKIIKNTKERTIFEGVELLFIDRKMVLSYPTIVLGTSLLISSIRAFKRNKQLYKNTKLTDLISTLWKDQPKFLYELKDLRTKIVKTGEYKTDGL